MKIPVFAFGLAVATGVAFAQTPPAPAPAPVDASKPATTTTTVTPAPAAKPGAAAPAKPPAKPAKPKEEPMGTIEGVTIARPNGTFLGLALVDGKFKLTFYNKKKKPVAVDVTRAAARWPNVHGPGDNRTILNSDGGTALVGSQFVRGPYTFLVFLTLLKGEGEATESVETYTVQFHD